MENLIKRNRTGCTKCCFCNSNETIQHLFLDCHVARLISNAVYILFGIQPPASISDLLSSWLRNYSVKLRKQILVRASALCQAIWLSRDDFVFQRNIPNSYLQVIFRGTYWTRCWSQLSKEEEEKSIKNSCLTMESAVMEFFSKFGWNFRTRIEA